MNRASGLLILLLLPGIFWGPTKLSASDADPPLPHLRQLSLPDLETRLGEVERELKWLAKYSLRSEIGAIGHRSEPRDDDRHTEWVEVELDGNLPIDRSFWAIGDGSA